MFQDNYWRSDELNWGELQGDRLDALQVDLFLIAPLLSSDQSRSETAIRALIARLRR